jgi:hypothetical protein
MGPYRSGEASQLDPFMAYWGVALTVLPEEDVEPIVRGLAVLVPRLRG